MKCVGSSFGTVLGVAGLLAAGFAGYNLLTTGCVLGVCATEAALLPVADLPARERNNACCALSAPMVQTVDAYGEGAQTCCQGTAVGSESCCGTCPTTQTVAKTCDVDAELCTTDKAACTRDANACTKDKEACGVDSTAEKPAEPAAQATRG